ncbi:MAG: nucleoside deaminase [Porphyromonadaceae bacterium]|nr:MAG: nucleoside deaminase [Porphyromonadaceae bacterium]
MDQIDKIFLARAIQLARENVAIGGGPFGAVIVQNGQTVAESVNQVISIPDPTAHAEIQTIRLAAKNLKTFDLTGTTLYTSCEPCPMCLGAVYWSRINRVVYASDRHDAEKAGFRDAELYFEIALDPDQRVTSFEQLDVPESGLEFIDWKNSDIKTDY